MTDSMRLLRLPWVAVFPVAAFALVFAGSFAYFRATDTDPKAQVAESKARPASAPGGGRLVLALHAVGSQEPAEAYLVSAAVDGSDVREITQPPEGAIAADMSPSVSPDGKTIAFARAIPGESPHIYLVGIDGSGLRRSPRATRSRSSPSGRPTGLTSRSRAPMGSTSTSSSPARTALGLLSSRRPPSPTRTPAPGRRMGSSSRSPASKTTTRTS
jgi:hypothetical protein